MKSYRFIAQVAVIVEERTEGAARAKAHVELLDALGACEHVWGVSKTKTVLFDEKARRNLRRRITRAAKNYKPATYTVGELLEKLK